MRNRWMAGALVVACGVGFAAGRAFTDDGPPSPEQMEAMEKAWKELGVVRDEHKRLTGLAGTYDLKVNSLDFKTGKWNETPGSATFTSILGGRFVRQDVKGTMEGQPFEGTGYLGFENATGKYISFWMDSMSTGWMTGTGVAAEDGKTITYSDVMHGPGGEEMKMRDVVTLISDKQFTFTMHASFGGMPEQKMMEITYTKK